MQSPKPDADQAAARPPFQPNMLVVQADLMSSTLSRGLHDHSVIADSRYLNCAFVDTNFEGSSFTGCEFDGSIIENSSLRAVELRNCDVEGLVINGIKIGALLQQLTGR